MYFVFQMIPSNFLERTKYLEQLLWKSKVLSSKSNFKFLEIFTERTPVEEPT